jgi:CubicO group peptidase (beta-lactamase class C family)
MRKRWFLLLALPGVAAILAASQELRETPLPSMVDSPAEFAAFVDERLPSRRTRYRLPGVCVGLVDGDLEHVRCHGTTRAGTNRPLDSSSRFGIASVSKAFTALSVLTLVADGSVGLDDPAERHLRSWRFPRNAHDGPAVTVRQLLTHTAGVGVPSYGGDVSPWPGETTLDVLAGRTAGRQPVALIAPPGSGFSYSGGGYMVLQLLVEDVSGLPFERYVTERVFWPLGMRDSSFSWGSERNSDTAGHDVAGRPLPPYTYGAAMAPGAMVTTAADMLRFVSAFAHRRIPAALGWPDGAWDRYVSPTQGRYGMGLTITEANGHLLVGHAGTTMGYDAGFTALPLEGAGWFVLENGNGGVFLKPELDRLFLQWKAQASDPRHAIVRWLRATVSFLAIMLPALGAFLLASLGIAVRSRRRTLAAARQRSLLRKTLRLAIGVALGTLLVLWVVFFHTDAFYPAFTTAWMPYAFRFVSLGAALLVLRGTLGCVFVREKQVPRRSGVAV